MAVYRNIHISFWQDDFIIDLTPEEKYFYLYLMTNSKTNQAGCYEISRKIMEVETGYNRETLEKLISRFTEYGKIKYCEKTKEILLCNWYKYSWSKSPKVIACVKKDINTIKSDEFKELLFIQLKNYNDNISLYGIDTVPKQSDTVPIEERNKNKNKNNNKKKNNNKNNNISDTAKENFSENENNDENIPPAKADGGKNDFIFELLNIFSEEYNKARGYTFDSMNFGPERAALGKMLIAHKKKYPNNNSEQTKEYFRNFFSKCVSIEDKWHHERMSPRHILSEITAIQSILNNKKNGVNNGQPKVNIDFSTV